MTRFDSPPSPRSLTAWGELLAILLLSLFAAFALLALPASAGLLGPGDAVRATLASAAIVGAITLFLRALHWVVASAFYAIVAVSSYVVLVLSRIVERITPVVTPRVLSAYLYVAFDSSPQEASEFFRMYMTPADTAKAVAVLLVVIGAALLFRSSSRSSHRVRMSHAGVLILVGAGLAFVSVDAFDRVAIPFITAGRQHKADMAVMARHTASVGENNVAITRPEGLDEVAEVYVLVIGESTTRHNMQLYGYGRRTTPRLSAMRDSLFVFEDAIAPHAHTIPVLKKLLTFADSEQPEAWRTAPDLLTIFRSAGFRTWWLSNQSVFGTYDTWITAFARRAHQSVFTNVGGFPHDDVLFAPFERALQDRARKKLIVIQLMGTHVRAEQRYPARAAVFGTGTPLPRSYAHISDASEKKLVDAYDNAVAFNDYVVAGLLDRLRQANASRAAFIYVADHGEEVKHVDSYLGHSEFRLSPYMLEIPLIVWSTPGITGNTASPHGALERRPHETDQLIHTILDLADVHTPGYRSERSLFATSYAPPPRRVAGIDHGAWKRSAGGESHPFSSTSAGSRDFPSRVWVHKTNSTEKLRALISKFQGFELDLVYESASDTFDVRHPPDPSIGLSLEEYFASHALVPARHFWLDLKNLDERNADAALRTLQRITARFGLARNVIVESPRPELLARFTNAGFYTSYYLPRAAEFDSPSDWLVEVSMHLTASRVNAVSTNGADYPLLRELEGYDRLLWSIPPEEVLPDPMVKVVLVKARS